MTVESEMTDEEIDRAITQGAAVLESLKCGEALPNGWRYGRGNNHGR